MVKVISRLLGRKPKAEADTAEQATQAKLMARVARVSEQSQADSKRS